MIEFVIVGFICLVVGGVVGTLVYRNNSPLFERLLAPYLKKIEDGQARIFKELEEVKKKLNIP